MYNLCYELHLCKTCVFLGMVWVEKCRFLG